MTLKERLVSGRNDCDHATCWQRQRRHPLDRLQVHKELSSGCQRITVPVSDAQSLSSVTLQHHEQ
jgi:hypothetical protein